MKAARTTLGQITAITLLGASSTAAHTDWPTSPSDPIVLGSTEFSFGDRLAIASTDDHAVWFAWQDSYCVGSIRLQRLSSSGELLTPIGLPIQDDPTCGFLMPPVLAPIGTGVLATRALAAPSEGPVLLYDPTGAPAWANPFDDDRPRALVGAVRFAGSDSLLITQGFGTLHADRLAPDGLRVWTKQTTVPSPSGANFDLFAAVPDDTGGAYLFWDSPLTYTRLIYAARINADGSIAWEEIVRPVEAPPGVPSSRHSSPIAIGDGQGGAYIFYTHGFETGTTPAPIYMQRVHPDGSLAFPKPGVRVSLDTRRQFDVQATLDTVTSDILVTWRDGQYDESEARAQRLTPAGQRLWGDHGIYVAPLHPTTGSFDTVWIDSRLSVAVAGTLGVRLHTFDANGSGIGVVDASPPAPSAFVRAAASDGGVVLAWQRAGDDVMVAQRVNRFQQLGGPPCAAPDLAAPFGSLNFFDIAEYIAMFNSGDSGADFAPPFGSLNFFDVASFIAAYNAGCP